MAFKIAVIGCGWISTACHGPVYIKYAADHPDTELTACCDVDASRAEGFRYQYGFARSYTDYHAMLEREKPDVVCLNVPEKLLCEMGCWIMEMGIPLFSEKPPGLTVAEIDRMIKTAKSTGVIHQVAFNRRFSPLVIELKRQMKDITVHHLDHQFYRIGRTAYDFTATAIHAVDTVRFLMGDYQHIRFHYQEFLALSQKAPTANFLLDCTFASGATALLSICPVTGVSLERTIVHGVDHTFFLCMNTGPDVPGRLQHFEKGQFIQELTGAEFTGSTEDLVLSGFDAENTIFFDAVRSGQQPVHDFQSCRQSVEIMACMRDRVSVYTV